MQGWHWCECVRGAFALMAIGMIDWAKILKKSSFFVWSTTFAASSFIQRVVYSKRIEIFVGVILMWVRSWGVRPELSFAADCEKVLKKWLIFQFDDKNSLNNISKWSMYLKIGYIRMQGSVWCKCERKAFYLTWAAPPNIHKFMINMMIFHLVDSNSQDHHSPAAWAYESGRGVWGGQFNDGAWRGHSTWWWLWWLFYKSEEKLILQKVDNNSLNYHSNWFMCSIIG